MADEGGKWLWPLGFGELFFEEGHKRRTFLIAYHLTITSASPLIEDQVKKAALHLHRKVPCLRVCIAERDGRRWFRETTSEKIDFEVLGDVEVEETLRTLRAYQYNSSTGPLWCVKLQRIGGSSSPSSPLLEDQNFPHQYNLFLGLHHSTVDGTSAMKICGFLVKLLNDIIAGQPINDEEQLGDFTGGERTFEMVMVRKEKIEGDPELKKMMADSSKTRTEKIAKGAIIFPKREDAVTDTRHILYELDVDTTSKFLKKCRAEGVTIHSAFSALANIAVTDLYAEKGILQDTYEIGNSHIFNMRRYWGIDTSRVLGLHVLPPLTLFTETKRNLMPDFWDYTRKVHQVLQENLNSGASMQDMAYQMIEFPSEPDFDMMFKMRLRTQGHYCTSNMGNVTGLVTEGGPHVQINNVMRTISIHYSGNPWSHIFHSFRGHFIHVLDYNLGEVTDEQAQIYSQQIFKHLREVI